MRPSLVTKKNKSVVFLNLLYVLYKITSKLYVNALNVEITKTNMKESEGLPSIWRPK